MSENKQIYIQESTLQIIRNSYIEASNHSKNLLKRLEHFYNNLIANEDKIEEIDEKSYDYFIHALKNCMEYRRISSDIQTLVTYVNTTIIYIILWLNSTKNYSFDIKLYARQKSLESDLTKLLIKAVVNDQVYNIRDRFGIRGIIENDQKDDIYALFESIDNILAEKNRKIRKEFIDWYSNNQQINLLTKNTISAVLEIPFNSVFIKDFIQNPKSNGYQSLQFTLEIPMYSETLPGCQFEVQLRTKNMHDIATNGSAAHDRYKDQIPEEIKHIFLLEEDIDNLSGIKEPLKFFPRMICGMIIQ